jgi:hypothetical protein
MFKNFVTAEEAWKKLPGTVCSQSFIHNCQVGRYLQTEDLRTAYTYCVGPSYLSVLHTQNRCLGTDMKIPLACFSHKPT